MAGNTVSPEGVDLSDDQSIARHLLPRVFPPGKRADAARRIKTDPKNFTRWCNGHNCSAKFLPKLLLLDEYAEAYRRLKKQAEPRIAPEVAQAMTRVERAFGRSLTATVIYELENLSDTIGPVAAVEAIRAQARVALDAVDAIRAQKEEPPKKV